jgi:hypothetical protein
MTTEPENHQVKSAMAAPLSFPLAHLAIRGRYG